MHTGTPAYSIFDGPETNLLSVLCILVEVLSCAQTKRGKSLNDFKFGTSVGCFSSERVNALVVCVSKIMQCYMWKRRSKDEVTSSEHSLSQLHGSAKECVHTDDTAEEVKATRCLVSPGSQNWCRFATGSCRGQKPPQLEVGTRSQRSTTMLAKLHPQ